MMFEQGEVLLLLLLLPLFAGFFTWRSRRRDALLGRIAEASLLDVLTEYIDYRRRLWKSAFWLLALGSLIVALSRPVWGFTDNTIDVSGLSVMLVLDVSTSMDAQDVLPSRLERAKLTARELIESRSGDEFGLVIFAGTALVQLPLTADVNAAVTFLNAADTESITRQGTALETALRLALRSFDERFTAERAIIVMSDGENHMGQPLLAAEEAAVRGIPIFALGYGLADGAPIPIAGAVGESENYKSDRDGNLVITRLDEEMLQQVAEISGGTYQRAGESGIEVVNLLNSLADMRGGILESRVEPRQVSRFGIFVGLALLFLAGDILLSERRPVDKVNIP